MPDVIALAVPYEEPDVPTPGSDDPVVREHYRRRDRMVAELVRLAREAKRRTAQGDELAVLASLAALRPVVEFLQTQCFEEFQGEGAFALEDEARAGGYL